MIYWYYETRAGGSVRRQDKAILCRTERPDDPARHTFTLHACHIQTGTLTWKCLPIHEWISLIDALICIAGYVYHSIPCILGTLSSLSAFFFLIAQLRVKKEKTKEKKTKMFPQSLGALIAQNYSPATVFISLNISISHIIESAHFDLFLLLWPFIAMLSWVITGIAAIIHPLGLLLYMRKLQNYT